MVVGCAFLAINFDVFCEERHLKLIGRVIKVIAGIISKLSQRISQIHQT